MKVNFYQVLIFLFILTTVTIPVAAITAGNGTNSGGPVSAVQSSTVTYIPSTYQTIAPQTINVSQNLGIIPVWLLIGIFLIVIALSGLLWRYFHPKYIPPEEKE